MTDDILRQLYPLAQFLYSIYYEFIPDMVPLQCHLISHLQQNYSRDIKVEEKPQTEDSKGKPRANTFTKECISYL